MLREQLFSYIFTIGYAANACDPYQKYLIESIKMLSFKMSHKKLQNDEQCNYHAF